jgi:hypothetical protein
VHGFEVRHEDARLAELTLFVGLDRFDRVIPVDADPGDALIDAARSAELAFARLSARRDEPDASVRSTGSTGCSMSSARIGSS